MACGLDGRVALVTGAGRGIGAATAIRLAADRATVAINDIDAFGAEETATTIREGGGNAKVFAADVGDPEQSRQLVREVVDAFGGLGILVNNAGVEYRAELRAFPRDEWDRTLRVNLSGPFFLVQEAADPLVRSGHGAIVNICSTAVIGFFGQPAYDASKGGLLTLTRAVAVELGREGVRVNAVCPGFIDTPMMAREDLKDIGNRQVRTLPISRMGRSSEVAAAVSWLASDDSSYVTGQALFVDGGWVRS